MRKKNYYARRRISQRRARKRLFIVTGLLVAAFAVGVFLIVKAISDKPGDPTPPSASAQMQPPDNAVILPDTYDDLQGGVHVLSADLVPYATQKTDPALFGMKTDIMVDDEIVDAYIASEPIAFGTADTYSTLEGLTTFRGNHHRDMPAYGTADITEQALELVRTKSTGAIGKWGGATWTGQPLIVKWPAKTRENMTSLYPQFADKDDLTEVIYATLDGYIHFLDLETGEDTRDRIAVGAPTTGTASIDPRGYPIIYVGQGLQANGNTSNSRDMYMRAFSLIDGMLLMKFGYETADPFAHRSWQAFSSSPLIDANSNTLIVPGENGVLYVCELDAFYDEGEGVVGMAEQPSMVKYRYTSQRNEQASTRGRWGTQSSAIAWRDNLIFADNAGLLQCIDLNTMELIYVNDLTDDSDMTMVLEEDAKNDRVYLYAGCNYDELVRDLGPHGPVYARKLDALTGEVIWETEFIVKSDDKSDGGILASPVIGRQGTSMDGLVFFSITQEVVGNAVTSSLVALDKQTGAVVFRYDMEVSGWSPSSPVPVYTPDGTGYIIQCDSSGNVTLLRVEDRSFKVSDILNIGGAIEATPAVFNDRIVVATRKSQIFVIKIK